MLSAHDVARELRQRLPDAGAVKIHKLLYYCQGWHLAWIGTPMFAEQTEAWVNGPVVADVWHTEDKERPRPDPQQPGDEHVAVISYVVGRYGRHTGRELIRITHLEDPWRDVSESDASFRTRNPVISHESLGSWFRKDEEFQAQMHERSRLSERRDIYGFDGPAMPDDLREATLRALERQSGL